MSVSEAHTRASVKYNKSRDNIMIRPTIEDGREIRAAAKAERMSVQSWVLRACREQLNAPALDTGEK